MTTDTGEPRTLARPAERHAFILAALETQVAVDVLDRDFVVAYVEATGASATPVAFGAPRCPMLGRDLAALCRAGRLDRFPVGISGGEVGFPSWVYSYTLPDHAAGR